MVAARMALSWICVALSVVRIHGSLGVHDSAGAAASVTGTVEHLHSPAGIATLRPRFSWDISANNRRNLTQLAYSLSIDATADVRGDCCSSGWIDSPASTLVECAPTGGGALALRPGRVYWWREAV